MFNELQTKAAAEWKSLRESRKPMITVGAATCGISAGADRVIETLSDLKSSGENDFDVMEVGCIGLCYAEPIINVAKPGCPTIVYGNVALDRGVITHPIGRHPYHRKKMSIKSSKGRPAETQWLVKERFSSFSVLKCIIKTGRTHQIRVHMSSMSHSIVGDSVYTGGKKNNFTGKKELNLLLNTVTRQMLHAKRMRLVHPVTEKKMTFESMVPPDMDCLINGLRELEDVVSY